MGKSHANRILVLVTLSLVALVTLFDTKPSSAQTAWRLGTAALAQDTQNELEITWNPLTGTPSFIRGKISFAVTNATSLTDTAFAVANQYGGLFGIKQATKELNTVGKQVDSLGMYHVTLEQHYQGIPVYGAYMKIHTDKDGQVLAVSNGFVQVSTWQIRSYPLLQPKL